MTQDSPVDPDDHEIDGLYECPECLRNRTFHLVPSDDQPEEGYRNRYDSTCEWCGFVREEVTTRVLG